MQALGIKPWAETFNSLIRKANDFETAQKVFVEMKKMEVLPTKTTFQIGMGKANTFDEAWKIYQHQQSHVLE